MVLIILEVWKTIKKMDTAYVISNKVTFMQANGKMVWLKVLAHIYFKIVMYTKDKFIKAKSMVMVNIYTIMVIIMMENGKMIKKMALVYFIINKKINNIRVIGPRVFVKVKAYTNGKMGINMKVVLLMESKVEEG